MGYVHKLVVVFVVIKESIIYIDQFLESANPLIDKEEGINDREFKSCKVNKHGQGAKVVKSLNSMLNKRDELLETCRHQRKQLIASLFKPPKKKEPPDTTIK